MFPAKTATSLHPKVILHIDIDYFYAQVEELLNPELKDKPFGIKQGMNIVTCNYIAREFGVKKWRPIKECLEKCPSLVMVNGEDLSHYKVYSKKLADILHSTFGPSERMGLDEHYLDITKLVEDRLLAEPESHHMNGPIFPNEDAFAACNCGCSKRLGVGSEIARDIRQKLLTELKLTCSVGIAHNKLLAKLVGNQNKPDNQTTLAPLSAQSFMASLENIRSITGIGGKTASRIEELGVTTIEELQNCDVERLRKTFGADMATRLKQMAMGEDPGDVKPSGKPKTVGLEDSCRPISIRSDAQEKFRALLPRLVAQIQDDGRIPQSIKVTVRKYDPVKRLSSKETKQFGLPGTHFQVVDGKVQLAEGANEAILKNVMASFDHLTAKAKFNINLLGLCFGKFRDLPQNKSSIVNLLMKGRKTTDGESSSKAPGEPPVKKIKLEEAAVEQETKREAGEATSSLGKVESRFEKAVSSSEAASAPKKVNRQREQPQPPAQPPPTFDVEVFNALPVSLQQELLSEWKSAASPQSKQHPMFCKK